MKPTGKSLKANLDISKASILLNQKMGCETSLIVIFSEYLRTIKSNEKGITEDIDPESLHHFRVNLRKTRSIIKQFKKILREDVIELSDKFSDLAKQTNTLRDIDVFLQSKEKYESIIPAHLHPGLDIFFNKLKRKRRYRLTKVRSLLKSTEYKNIKKHWSYLLSNDDKNICKEKLDKTIRKTASDLIYKRFLSILKDGENISKKHHDKELHKLRIQCKKLRYLLEAFTNLFPEKKIKMLISELKKLQDNLGNFNDSCVQIRFLDDFLKRETSGKSNEHIYYAALGGLLGILGQQKINHRKDFTQNFNRFQNRKNRELFEKLFQKTNQ